uniref:BLUF domain protein n=1 Tax=Rhodopseudomonas palustris (strain BisA53) TaxID=316055 RepID=Q07NU1_RHOP5
MTTFRHRQQSIPINYSKLSMFQKTDSKDHLIRLLYRSRPRVTAGIDAVKTEIEVILEKSRRNNERRAVTGALIFNSGLFVQVLEGPSSAIEELFEIIQQDERHFDVEVLMCKSVERRAFPAWSMAYIGRSDQYENVFGDIATVTGYRTDQLEGDRLFRIVMEMAFEEERMAT